MKNYNHIQKILMGKTKLTARKDVEKIKKMNKGKKNKSGQASPAKSRRFKPGTVALREVRKY